MACATPDAQPNVRSDAPDTVSAWLLAGGEGRRMQGRDKGLVDWQGRPLAAWALDSLRPPPPGTGANTAHLGAIGITANRHAEHYRDLLQHSRLVLDDHVPLAVPGGVLPDDADLPDRSGPMAGILTALRHSHTPWVLVLPCDTPCLPQTLWPKLLEAALQARADIAVPTTQSSDGPRHHWVCALMRRSLLPSLREAFVNGERKIGRWTQAQPWVSVCFSPETDFQNMNTLETLHGRD